MPQYTTLEQLKQHLVIDYVEEGEDEQLTLYLDAAESRIEKEINQGLYVFAEGGELNRSLVVAILILAGTLYANREAVAYTTAEPVPYTLNYLLQPFKKYD